MRYTLLLGSFLTVSALCATHANASIEGSYYCLDQSKRLIADYSVKNARESYTYVTCCDEGGCLDEDPTGRCPMHLGQKADATIRFYGGILPGGAHSEFELESSKDRFQQVAFFGSGKLGFGREYSFFTKGGFNYFDSSSRGQGGYFYLLEVEERISGVLTMAECKETSVNKDLKYVYKVFKLDEWVDFQEKGEFLGSADDIRDGFIHLASNDQVDYVINKFFANEKTVYVAEFLTRDLGAMLKWESNSSENIYPHLYQAPLKREAIQNFEKRTNFAK
jgi:uncharacterized protein (DUF952 family)